MQTLPLFQECHHTAKGEDSRTHDQGSDETDGHIADDERDDGTAADTQGCILPGRNRVVGQVVDSKIWLYRLKKKIVEAKARDEPVWITIK